MCKYARMSIFLKQIFITMRVQIAWAVRPLPGVKLLQDDTKAVNVSFLRPPGGAMWQTKNFWCHP